MAEEEGEGEGEKEGEKGGWIVKTLGEVSAIHLFNTFLLSLSGFL